MDEELKILVPVEADDSAGARKRFKTSINKFAKELKGDNAPKIEVTVKKINAQSAIKVFKKEIEQAIGALNTTKLTTAIKNSTSKTTKSKIDSEARAFEKIKSLQEKGTFEKDLKITESSIQKFRILGNEVDDLQKQFQDAKTWAEKLDNAIKGDKQTEAINAYNKYKIAIDQAKNSKAIFSNDDSITTRFDKDKQSINNLILQMQRIEKANDKLRLDKGMSLRYDKLFGNLNTAFNSNDHTDVAKLRQEVTDLEQALIKADLTGQKFGTKLGQQFQKFGVYLSASTLMIGAIAQLRKMIQNVTELDRAMTELKKVTNETSATYTNFLDNAEVRAKKLGATLVDVVSVTAD